MFSKPKLLNHSCASARFPKSQNTHTHTHTHTQPTTYDLKTPNTYQCYKIFILILLSRLDPLIVTTPVQGVKLSTITFAKNSEVGTIQIQSASYMSQVILIE